MGEYVWTQYNIGGKIKRSKVAELELNLSSYGYQDMRSGIVLDAACERNYGNDEELDAFLQANNLTFTRSWSAQQGAFFSGQVRWKPGMEQMEEVETNDDYVPVLSLIDLIAHANNRVTLADLIAQLTFDVPVLEIEEDADAV